MSTKHSALALIAALALLLTTGCGKEVGRVPFTVEGSQAATLQLEAGEVAFWTDIDLQHEGAAALIYQIDLVQSGSSVASAECNALGPMNVKVGWVETSFGSSHSRRGNGKMACSATLAKGGPTSVQATLGFNPRPTSAALSKADLVVKQ